MKPWAIGYVVFVHGKVMRQSEDGRLFPSHGMRGSKGATFFRSRARARRALQLTTLEQHVRAPDAPMAKWLREEAEIVRLYHEEAPARGRRQGTAGHRQGTGAEKPL